MTDFPPVSNLRAGADSRPNRPRLLVLASTFPAVVGDGTPAFVADLARVEATAFDTVVLAPLVPGAAAREDQFGYQIRRYRFFPGRRADLADGAILENLRARPSRWLQVPSFFLAGALAVRRAVRDTAPDVVHVHWIIPQGLMALLAARKVPWLVTTLGGDLYALKAAPARFLKRQVLKRAGAVTVMNEEMRQVVIGLGVSPERVRVLPMGVALERLRPVGDPPARVPGRLVFVGGVVFHGQQGSDALRRLLGQAQLAVFPSVRARSGDQDGLPVATLEALAAGTPVIASNLPGLSAAVGGGEEPAGVLVEPGDVAGLTAAVTRLLGDDATREHMGRVAEQRASAYSMESIGAQYVTQLKDIAAGAGT
jgi:colanic acid/amylovoran biosynthesis glycosyltransferase